MKKEDLDALAGLYEGVYLPNSGEYLSEYAGGQGPSAADLIRQRQAAKQQSQMKGLSIGQGGFRVNNKPVNPGMSPIFQRPGAKPPTRPAATAPATRPAATAPTAKPGTPGSGSKVVPSSAAKPATPAKPAGSAMDQWAAANPKLAAAKAERDRTRGTSATTNPLMKDFKDKLPAPKAPSPTTSTTAFAKSTPALGSSSSAVQSAGSASAAKPTTNQTSTAFSSPSLVKPAAPTSAAKPAATIQKRPSGPGTGAMTRGGASGDVGPNARTIRSSYEWGSKATLKDVASLYSSIYEGKKKDQDKDGDNDFADVRIARMIASGMSKAEAIAAVRNKEYNEEFELDEAAKRTPKKTRGAKDPVAYMKGRSDAGKRISGDEDTGPRYYTLGRARGAEADAPTQPGQKPVRTPKLAGWEKDDIKYRKANLRAGKTHKVGGSKGLPEEYEIYEIVASYLLENNFAATVNDANVIIENMSEVWLSEILENLN